MHLSVLIDTMRNLYCIYNYAKGGMPTLLAVVRMHYAAVPQEGQGDFSAWSKEIDVRIIRVCHTSHKEHWYTTLDWRRARYWHHTRSTDQSLLLWSGVESEHHTRSNDIFQMLMDRGTCITQGALTQHPNLGIESCYSITKGALTQLWT